MNSKNQNLDLRIGNWGPGWGGPWGGPWGGYTAFGADEFQQPMDPNASAQAMALMQAGRFGAGGGGYPLPQQVAIAPGVNPFGGWGPGCGGFSPAYVDPGLVNSMIAKQHSVIVGPDFGPQEVEQMLGCEEVDDLAAGATAIIEFTPELVCKLTRLFIPTSLASQLIVTDLSIGIKSQFPGKGRIPGLVFSEVSTNNRINGDTCYIRQPIVLTVVNCSDTTIAGDCFALAVGVVAVQGGGPRIIGPGSGHA